MKVLWVNPAFLDYRIPLYKEVYNLLDKDFYLIYGGSRVPKRCVDKIEAEIGDHSIPVLKDRIYKFGKLTEFANSGIILSIPKGLDKLIKSVKPDLIIAEGFGQFTPWAVMYCFTHRVPLLIAYERTAHTERNCPKWRLWYRKLIGKFVCGYIVNGKLTKEYLMSNGVNPDVIFTGAMCADSKHLAEEARAISLEEKELFRTSLGIVKRNGITYLFVGRLIDLKGVQYLLKAWQEHVKKYPNDYLLIVGGGPMEDEFRSQYAKEKSVILTGNIDYSLVHNYYAISDVFVIPTLEDNWSLVVPEAMASGLPVACSIYNGCYPELVKEGKNGALFDTYNKSSILNALEVFHKCNLEDYGKTSIEIEKEYSPEQVAKNIYNAIVKTYNKMK